MPCWEEWCSYFKEQYLFKKRVNDEDLWAPSWHSALKLKGHPASQQSGLAFRRNRSFFPFRLRAKIRCPMRVYGCAGIEMMWRKFKCFIKATGPLKTHMALADACEKAMSIFSAPLSPGEEQTDRAKHSLLAPPGHLALDAPTGPDAWMLSSTGTTVRRTGGRQFWIPSIPTILRKASLAGGAAVPRVQHGDHTFVCMAIGQRTKVPVDVMNNMISQVKCRTTQARLVAL